MSQEGHSPKAGGGNNCAETEGWLDRRTDPGGEERIDGPLESGRPPPKVRNITQHARSYCLPPQMSTLAARPERNKGIGWGPRGSLLFSRCSASL